MKPVSLQVLAGWAGGDLLRGNPETQVSAVSTDTRSIAPGSLFVALKGERFDGHDFAVQAAQAGAAALLVSRPVDVPLDAAVILVRDTLDGLQRLAAKWRSEWRGIVIGVTGSNGKTSTKDIAAAILSQRWDLHATRGNLNNHIGLPLTLLETAPGHRAAICEIGINHPGELGPLAAIAGPDAAIITNIGTAHLEYMGSREAIAREKGMLAEAVPPHGCVILNANDDYTPAIAARCRATILTAGIGGGDVRVDDLRLTTDGSQFRLTLPDGDSGIVHLPVPGRHMAGNAALAAAAGFHFGMRLQEIGAGLTRASLTRGRMQLRRTAGYTFLDDSYNASPESMIMALETLESFARGGRRIAVLGAMAERGSSADEEHRQIGAEVCRRGLDLLFTVGTGASRLIGEGYLAAGGRPDRLTACDSAADCVERLRAAVLPGDLILIKGSRTAAMERIIELMPC